MQHELQTPSWQIYSLMHLCIELCGNFIFFVLHRALWYIYWHCLQCQHAMPMSTMTIFSGHSLAIYLQTITSIIGSQQEFNLICSGQADIVLWPICIVCMSRMSTCYDFAEHSSLASWPPQTVLSIGIPEGIFCCFIVTTSTLSDPQKEPALRPTPQTFSLTKVSELSLATARGQLSNGIVQRCQPGLPYRSGNIFVACTASFKASLLFPCCNQV